MEEGGRGRRTPGAHGSPAAGLPGAGGPGGRTGWRKGEADAGDRAWGDAEERDGASLQPSRRRGRRDGTRGKGAGAGGGASVPRSPRGALTQPASPAQRPLHARVGRAARLRRPGARQAQVPLQAAVGVQRRGGRARGRGACGGAALMLQGAGLGPLPHPAADSPVALGARWPRPPRVAAVRRLPLAAAAAAAGSRAQLTSWPLRPRAPAPARRARQSAPAGADPAPHPLFPGSAACGHLGEGQARPQPCAVVGRG